MAINERLIHTAAAGAVNEAEQGLILHLDANDVDSYDGDGSEWVDIANHEYKPATNPSEHFNTVTYSGTGASNPITGVGFQPDLIWVKRRTTSTANHYIVDTVRGNGTSTYKNLSSNTTDAEGTTTTSGITNSTIVDGGFTMQGTGARTNADGSTYVAWCFKAGGAPVSNTDGSITSSVSANNDLGFSVVEFNTGTSHPHTVGHGLDSKPEMVITKVTNTTSDWLVYHKDLSNAGQSYLLLNTNASVTDYGSDLWNYSNWDSTKIGGQQVLQGSNNDVIAYCFASKRGVSKVGSYEGTGTSGNKVYTGFEPAWVMLKNADDIGSWRIYDNVRGVTNALYPNLSNAEATNQNNVTFNRDGFTVISTGGSYNTNNETYIYLAFAKDTNFDDLIDDTDLELHLDAGDDSTVSTSTWSDKANSNDGTLSGFSSTLTDFYEKELGNYIDFDGSNDKITIEDNTNYSQLSVEVWVNPDNVGTGYYNNFIGRGYYTSLSDRKFWTLSNPNKSYVDWNITYNSNSVKITSSQSLPSNTWTHILATLDSSGNTKLYQNGELVASGTGATALNIPSNYRTVIGERPEETGLSTGWYAGKIGQVRIYSTALSQDQVRQNYNFTKNDYPNGFNADFVGLSSSDWNPDGYFSTNSGKYLNLGSDTALNFSTNKTISVWVNPASSSGNRGILGRINNISPYGWILKQANGNAQFNFYNSSGTLITSSSTTIPVNTWTHLAVTYNGSNLIFYKNGSEVSTTSTTAVPATPSANTLIGRFYSNVNVVTYDFIGKISDVKIFDRVLTSDEISAQEAIGYNGIG